MPTREQVWEAAERVRAAGERVTQKRVLDDLRARRIGGTERTINDHLIAWKAAQNYDPRLELRELPPSLKASLAAFMEGLWDSAMAEAGARLEERRIHLERERDAAGQLLDEAQIRAEETARDNEALRARQAEMAMEIAALRREVDHLRKAEFWDRVIREIAEILPEQEWMTTEEIVQLLPPSLTKEALVLDKALTPRRVNRQMALRDHHLRFFERDGKAHRYRKRPGWTGITQPPGPNRKKTAGKPAD